MTSMIELIKSDSIDVVKEICFFFANLTLSMKEIEIELDELFINLSVV